MDNNWLIRDAAFATEFQNATLFNTDTIALHACVPVLGETSKKERQS